MITVQNAIISKEQVLAIVAGQGISWTLVLNFYLHAIILRYHLLKLTTSEFTYALNEYTSETGTVSNKHFVQCVFDFFLGNLL